MTTRQASCCCGELTILVTGEPERVIACHCTYCQRRTGNVSQTTAWYFEDQIVSAIGDYETYQSPENETAEYRFCPKCGSTVYWHLVFLDGMVDIPVYGFAVGCFNDPEYPPPEIEIHTSNRSDWIPAIPGADTFHEFPPLERMVPGSKEHIWRSHPRMIVEGEATVQVVESDDPQLVGHEYVAVLHEVSLSGLRISCDQPLGDCVLELWVTTGSKQRLRLNAESRWHSLDEDDNCEIGLEIIDNPLTDYGEWCDLVGDLPVVELAP